MNNTNEGHQIIYYKDDYDILYVHRLITDCYFKNKEKKLKSLDTYIEKFRNKLQDESGLSRIRKKTLENKIRRATEIKEILLTDSFYKEYHDSVIHLLRDYKRNVSRFRKVFGSSQNSSNNEALGEREAIVDEYAKRIRNYSHIIMIKMDSEDEFMKCFRCLEPRVIEGSMIYCEHCNIKHDYLDSSNFQAGSRKCVPIRKNGYHNVKNFISELNKMQGKDYITFDESIFEILDNYFEKNNYLTSKEIKKMPLRPDGKRGPYTKHILRQALHDCNLQKYYKDIDSLTRDYWGWKLINLTNDQIMRLIDDYTQSQIIFNSIMKDRTSVINLEYRKFRHLINIGIPCKISDFIIVKTEDILREYEKMWKIVCEKLQWKFVPITDYICEDENLNTNILRKQERVELEACE